MSGTPGQPLVLDIGNTRVRAARPAPGDPGPRPGADGGWTAGLPWERLVEFPTPGVGGGPELTAALAPLLAAGGPGPVVVSSVVPFVSEALRAWHPEILVVDASWDLPFGLDLSRPDLVGADRLCNVAAAVAAGLPSALVVDAGTATTVDVLRDGVFVGGLIAPGMALAAGCLADRTAQLGEVPFAACPLAPGRDTATAMAAGCYHVGVQGVLGTVAALGADEGRPPVVVTGGLAAHLGEAGFRDDDWTLRGAWALARRRLAGAA